MTLRALVIGLCGAWILAYLTPWNDWAAGNSLVHGSYLPPVFLVALVILCGVINPRLKSHRLRPPEIATILALLLVVGSMASIGLMRHFPTVLIEPERTLRTSTTRSTWMPNDLGDDVASVTAEQRTLATTVIAIHDRNHDNLLDASERRGLGLALANADRTGDGNLDATELLMGLVPSASASPVPPYLHVSRGAPVRLGSIEDERLSGGFLHGFQGVSTTPGTTFVMVDDHGQRQRLTYLDGSAALTILASGGALVDPDSDPRAAGLLALHIGESLTIDGQQLRLEARIAASIPWSSWLIALLAWSPVILAMIAGALALAAIVRHQWTHNERLPMPIANVLGSLIGNDADGARPPIYTSRALWITASLVFCVHGIRMLYRYGYSPFDIPMEADVYQTFSGVFAPLDRSPNAWYLLTPHLYLTIVAMAFLMTTEVSGSLWGVFVGVNLLAGVAVINGVEISEADFDHGAVGASWMLCLLIIWIGRRHYLATLAAAFGRNRTPEAAQAAPWIWVLFGACALLIGFFMTAGIPLWTSIAVTLIIFSSMLALARMVAETGAPFASFGRNGRISGIILSLFGPTCGPVVLMPLLMIGFVVGLGDRERLLPHVLHGMVTHERTGGTPGSRGLLVAIGFTCLGCALVSFIAMITISYHWGSLTIDNWPSNNWHWATVQGDALLTNPAEAQQHGYRTWIIYGIGAAVFATLGIARLRWSRFPINPIALIALGGWVTLVAWASFAVGWLAKVLVLRYGGQALYRRLFPVTIGLILGEAAIVTVGMVIGLIRAYLGLDPGDLRILP